MVSSPDDNHGSPAQVYAQVISKFQGDLAARLDVQQMFILIDGVLPFEACLYHQVLPLSLEGSRLFLGMVTLDDYAAIDYVRRIVAYHHYSLVPRSISAEALQAALSAYLGYSRNKGNSANSTAKPLHPPTAARILVQEPINPDIQPTLIVDSPDDLEDVVTAMPVEPVSPRSQSPTPVQPQAPSLYDYISHPASPSIQVGGADADIPFTTIKDDAEADVASEQQHPAPSPNAPAFAEVSAVPPLVVQTRYQNSPVEVLAQLPPRELIQELLGRVLVGGIGRLYFERHAKYGRILWSQNGVLQSVLEHLNLDVFQSLLAEMKRLAQMPQLPVEQPKQVEVERLYEQNRALLRFRFMRGTHGEEATLQVLRGAALKFYQQQQLANLERDALRIARQLQTKLNEIRDRARSEAGSATKLDALPALGELLKTIEEQLDSLQPDLEINE